MPRRPFEKDAVSEFPSGPGVYLFFGERDEPLYVGKALNLRARVRSYFSRSADQRVVTRLLEGHAKSMDFVVTDSEKEALILENSLIKKHAPRFNIRLRDDKTYFSLRLDLKEEWPMLRIVRKRRKDDALYFGPYPSARSCRRTIQYLGAIFPLRTCPDSVLYNRVRPCLSYEIGRCAGPCVGYVERERYMELVDRVVRFLRGQDGEVLEEIEAEMLQASEALQFERAAELRDRLDHMRTTLENPRLTRRGSVDRDVVGLYDSGDGVVLCVLHIREGNLAASATFSLGRYGGPDGILGSFLGQYYGGERTPPPEILLPRECSDPELHREILEDLRGATVALKVPERGEGVRLLALAEKNAQLAATTRRKEDRELKGALEGIQNLLGLLHLPEHMECYDISHLGGAHVVGSRVTFTCGKPDKSLYRHYRLRAVQRNDDPAAMEEVLRRRLTRGLREDDLPDLIVIDGGPAQLSPVLDVLRSLRIDTVDVIALAKARSEEAAAATIGRYERVYLPDREVPVVLGKDAPETHLLARLRDEAHRFAITYSRRLRKKGTVRSVLEMIPGVGHRRRQALLQRFGSVRAIRKASVEEVTQVSGISRSQAEEIKAWLRDNTLNRGEESLPDA